MADMTIDVNVHGKGADFSVRRAGEGQRTQWLQIGTHIQHASVFLADADLIRLRDVIDTHLSTYAEELRGEGEKKERVAA